MINCSFGTYAQPRGARSNVLLLEILINIKLVINAYSSTTSGKAATTSSWKEKKQH